MARTRSSDDEDLDRVLALMAIPGGSGDEEAVAQHLRQALLDAGADPGAIVSDTVGRRTPIRSKTGNLSFTLPGTRKEPRRLLMAHMDTVPICIGTRPVVKGDKVVSGNVATGLGADDRAGCAVVLGAALAVLREKLPHPPLTFLWTVQEETGLHGARLLDKSKLGKPQLAFNWDGGDAGKLTVGATGGYRMTVAVSGKASHAGGAPEQGVSAIAIAGIAIAELQKKGWHGAIAKGKFRGTSNVGVIRGGAATNVVCDAVELRVEARSHDPQFRKRIVDEIEGAFRRAAAEVRNVSGEEGSVTFDGRLDYESFRLADDEPTVLAAEAAVSACGGRPERAISNGGLDANWLSARGIPTVTLGCGQRNPHMKNEELDIEQYRLACRIARHLASA
ncbi:MAG TPA: M20/M25/M40 family metallo-hydrolase [Pirellulaceae bacterium]|nr:M20/M25/M40 family metallo-hydrolase [Pirellulaceae bacterium]